MVRARGRRDETENVRTVNEDGREELWRKTEVEIEVHGQKVYDSLEISEEWTTDSVRNGPLLGRDDRGRY